MVGQFCHRVHAMRLLFALVTLAALPLAAAPRRSADIEFLQRLMDETLVDITPHMASIVTADKRLRASQVVHYLEGIKYVAFGSVTPAGEPRVSPLDSVFVHGRFTLSTDSSAARVTNLRRNRLQPGSHG